MGMMNSAGAETASPGRVRRVSAVVLSLVVPGAGHFLLGAFRRGAAWAVGLAVLGMSLLFATTVSLLALVAVVVALLGHIATALDTARIVASRPSWKRVTLAWAALLVGNFAVVEPLKIYYRTHYAQAFTIPSGAMQPTLLVGDYIMVDKSAYRVRAPERGDIIVFPYPQDERRDFVKRVVALPGEQVLIRGNQVSVNGRPLQEPYVNVSRVLSSTPGYCGYAYGCEPTTVPPNSYFVMGDSRDNSQDSRYWGFVRREKIKGRAVTVYWSWDTERGWPRFDRIGRSL
jgi:signal peptidase I